MKWLVLLLALSLPVLQSQAPEAKKAREVTTESKSSKPLDINTASVDELRELPGIGEKYSARIVAGRPYANKAQLVSKGIIPQATYSKISKLIVAKQP